MVDSMDWREVGTRTGFDLRLGLISQGVDNEMHVAVLTAAFASLDMKAEIIQIEPDATEFDEAVFHLKECGFRVAAVGNPHKVLAARLGEKFFLATDSVGVANALTLEEKIYARNTEVPGFARTIAHLPPGKALVMGTGQVARSVSMGLFQTGWKIRSWNRNAMKTRVLQTMFKRYGEIELAHEADPAGCTLVVNATPVGVRAGEKLPLVWSHVIPKTVVYDLIIRRVPTELQREATLRGVKTLGGRDLMVEQSALAVEWWVNKEVPREPLKAVVGVR